MSNETHITVRVRNFLVVSIIIMSGLIGWGFAEIQSQANQIQRERGPASVCLREGLELALIQPTPQGSPPKTKVQNEIVVKIKAWDKYEKHLYAGVRCPVR